MPLSEEELRLLEQMEQALAQEDPKFASTLRGQQIERAAKVRTFGAAGVFVLGFVCFLGGAVSQQIWLAVVGFLVMVPAATFALTTWRGRGSTPPSPAQQVERSLTAEGSGQPFSVVEGGRSQKRRQRAPKQSRRQPKASGTFMQRMEQRWERRRRQGY